MGQDRMLFNLDKSEYFDCGGKLGEVFFDNLETYMLDLLLSGLPGHSAWGGDRILLLGDYSKALPPNTVTDDDSVVLKKCVSTDQSNLRAFEELWEHGRERESYLYIDIFFPISEDTVYILRSHSKKEYVRRDVLRGYRQHSTMDPSLAQALFVLVGWSESPSAVLLYNDEGYIPASGGTTVPLHRGAWAGNRIDIVVLTDEVQETLNEQGWTDISEEKARHVSDVYGYGGCECDILCHASWN